MHLDGPVATIGISKFAVDQLTDLIMIDPEARGDQADGGPDLRRDRERQGRGQATSTPRPVSGEVIEVNAAVTADVPGARPGTLQRSLADQARVEDPRRSRGPARLARLTRKKVAEEGH